MSQYHVESVARKEELDASSLTLRRRGYSIPVLKKIEALLLAKLHAVAPATSLGKALHYAHGQWSKLQRYADDGEYPIDNNACENSIRPFVIRRRNWLFADTVAGANANASANLYSLLQTCKANGIDGYSYMRRLRIELPKASIADDYDALLPWSIGIAAN
jgi:transposase